MIEAQNKHSNALRSPWLRGFALDRNSSEPVHRQIAAGIVTGIRTGALQPGDALPSSRALAACLGVARATVVTSFRELEGEDWLESVAGVGTFVTSRPAPPATANVGATGRTEQDEVRFDLRTGRVDPALLTSRAWRAAWHQDFASTYPSPSEGDSPLLAELARYLSSTRNVDCRADDLIVCTGVSEALLVLGLGLGWAGRTVLVEDPCHPRVRRTLQRMGADVRPIAADDPDAMLDAFDAVTAATRPAAAYLTPNHQYPLGHRLDDAQRTRLLAWAAHNDCLLVEDDYDSEYRFGGPPPDTLCAANSTRAQVVYFGTLSKILDPGLRLAYLRFPPELRDVVRSARDDLGSTTSRSTQLVAARLLRSGEVSRHTARMRRIYGDRRAALNAALEHLPAVRSVLADRAGLHLVALLCDGLSSATVVRQAAARGVALADLDHYRAEPRPDRPGLVISFAQLTPTALRSAVSILRTVPELSRVPRPPDSVRMVR